MHLIIFGDSIGQGFFDLEKGGWVSLLSMYLQQKTVSSDYTLFNSVFNQSVSGENSTEIVSRIESELPARLSSKKKNILILAAGINNVRKPTIEADCEVSLEQTKTDLLRVKQIALENNMTVVVVGLTKVDEKLTAPVRGGNFLNSDIEKYDQVLRDTVGAEDLCFVSLFELLQPEHLMDGLHPNASGHQIIFEQVKNTLVKAGIL